MQQKGAIKLSNGRTWTEEVYSLGVFLDLDHQTTVYQPASSNPASGTEERPSPAPSMLSPRWVEGRSSVIETFKQLLAEERIWGMTKGLSARIISSTPTSVLIVVGYETLKRLSLRAELIESRHWSDEKLELQWTLEGHQLGVVSVDISHNGAIAASSSLDAHISLWDLESGKQIKSMDAGPVDAWTVAFSPDSKYIATGSHLGKVNIFGVESGKKEYSLDTRGKFILSIAYSPDGKYLASGAIDGIINIFDIATGKLLHTLEGHAMPIRSLTFSPDSQLLVTASDDGYIKIYDVQHANLAGTLSGHGSWVLNVAFSPDDTHFVSSSSDKSVKVWDASSRACINTFFDHQDQVWSVKYNSTGSKIISAGDDRAIHIYDCPM
ncbi:WD repeat-containing protein 61 [Lates japonicus]|uniref:Superkiller complex protein 8 n=2 Tax=Carangaria TaxID=1489904 RepID=A0AAD3MSF8_LATJO|nr:WD repeat-containing protein 61 [Lates japonicus]